MSKPDCYQQDDGGYWVCIVLEGWWDEKLRIDLEEKEFLPGRWITEEIRTCIICGDQDISYPL